MYVRTWFLVDLTLTFLLLYSKTVLQKSRNRRFHFHIYTMELYTELFELHVVKIHSSTQANFYQATSSKINVWELAWQAKRARDSIRQAFDRRPSFDEGELETKLSHLRTHNCSFQLCKLGVLGCSNRAVIFSLRESTWAIWDRLFPTAPSCHGNNLPILGGILLHDVFFQTVLIHSWYWFNT